MKRGLLNVSFRITYLQTIQGETRDLVVFVLAVDCPAVEAPVALDEELVHQQADIRVDYHTVLDKALLSVALLFGFDVDKEHPTEAALADHQVSFVVLDIDPLVVGCSDQEELHIDQRGTGFGLFADFVPGKVY
jgi:hypothetical protein